MPIERRYIMFTEEEVIQAIMSYARVTPAFLPQGAVVGCRATQTEARNPVELSITVALAYGRMQQTLELRAGDQDVIELLIRCCLENNIPIPRLASKRPAVMNNMLTLTISQGEIKPR